MFERKSHYLPGMNSLALGVFGHLQQMGHFEIRFRGRGWAYHESLIHNFRVLSELVSLGVHSNSLDTESMSCPCNTACNLASVSNQKLLEHLVLFCKVENILSNFHFR